MERGVSLHGRRCGSRLAVGRLPYPTLNVGKRVPERDLGLLVGPPLVGGAEPDVPPPAVGAEPE
jgi:hypothetical protein